MKTYRRKVRGAARLKKQRLFYGCSYMYHLSGNNRRDSHYNGLLIGSVVGHLVGSVHYNPARQVRIPILANQAKPKRPI